MRTTAILLIEKPKKVLHSFWYFLKKRIVFWHNRAHVIHKLKLSNYVKIMVYVPESQSENLLKIMGQAGAGRVGNYSFCSFSKKGVGRFLPNEKACPYQRDQDSITQVQEECIEMMCPEEELEGVVEAIKMAHPYEETLIDIMPIYEIGRKKAP